MQYYFLALPLVILCPKSDLSIIDRNNPAIANGDLMSVIAQVLDYLATYEVKTSVPHADYPRIGVPLFNVKGAVAGLHHSLERARATTRAQGLFEHQLDGWLSAYLAANTAERRGFVDALGFATPGQLGLLGWLALERLNEQPALTIVAAWAGLAGGDYLLLENAICRGSGPGVMRAIRAASSELADDEAVGLLHAVLRSAPAVNASLAIAGLAANRLDHPDVIDLLFATLPDRDLGMAAAVSLSASRQPEVHARLKGAVSRQHGLVQQRAQMALHISAVERGME